MRQIAFILLIVCLGRFPPAIGATSTNDVRACEKLGDPQWSEAEAFTWAQVCQGKAVDLATYGSNARGLNKKKPPMNRVEIGSEFLRSILLSEPYRSMFSGRQFAIKGFRVPGDLDLSQGALPTSVYFIDGEITGNANFDGSNSSYSLGLENFLVRGKLSANNARIQSLKILKSGANEIDLEDLVSPVVDLENISAQDLNFFASHIDHLMLGALRLNKYLQLGHVIAKVIYIENSNVDEGDFELCSVTADLQVVSSQFSDSLDLEGAHIGLAHFVNIATKDFRIGDSKIDLSFIMDKSRVDDFNAANASVGIGGIRLMDMGYVGRFDAGRIDIAGSLYAPGLAVDTDFHLCCSHISGSFWLPNSRIGGDILMYGTQIGSTLNISGGSVGNSTDLSQTIVTFVDAAGVRFCIKNLQKCELDLQYSRVASTLDLSGSEMGGYLRLSDTMIGGSALLKRGFVNGAFIDFRPNGHTIEIDRASIGEVLQVSGQNFSLVSLDSTKAKQFVFGEPNSPIGWSEHGSLSARNSATDVLKNYSWSWPKKLHTAGLQYDAIDDDTAKLEAGRKDTSDRWVEWLEVQPFSRPSYTQLAGTLDKMGERDAAKAILERQKEHEASEQSWIVRVVLWLYQVSVGYGYSPERAFLGVFIFTLAGAAILRSTGEGRINGMPYGLTFSLISFLPLIPLEKRYDSVTLKGIARYYFLVHQLIGYVLALFVAAALADLVPRN